VRTLLRAAAVTALAGLSLGTTAGCSSAYLSLRAAYNPPSPRGIEVPTPPGSPPLHLWAGDSNFHPPDPEVKVRRDLKDTIKLLQQSKLDFVFVTPFVPARFFNDGAASRALVDDVRELKQVLDTVAEPKPLIIMGADYQDKTYGSVALLFLDLSQIFKDLSRMRFKEDPGLFMRVAHMYGAVVSVNRPLATKVDAPIDTPYGFARNDRSWRMYTQDGAMQSAPSDIKAAHDLIYGLQAYSIPVSVWRDQLAYDDPVHSVREVLKKLDAESLARQKRLVPIGGSDSRSNTVRATMYIAAPERTERSLREGLLRGRVCVRSPEPCGLRVYADDDPLPQPVGSAVRAKRRLEFHWKGEGTLYKNGELLGEYTDDASVAPEAQCAIYRLELAGGYSGPVYVNCPFAEAPVL